jgi:hypothetical protein
MNRQLLIGLIMIGVALATTSILLRRELRKAQAEVLEL